MRSHLLTLAAVGLFAVGGANAARASDAQVTEYLQRASSVAATRLATEGVAVTAPLTVRAQVWSDGELVGARVVGTTGSPDLDYRAAHALRHLQVPNPPLALLGATVQLGIGQSAVQAKN